MSDFAHDMTLTADEQARLEATHAALSRQAGSYARVPMGEAFDVMCNELDDILNRVCGIEEVALAYQWMNRHSWKVPDRLGDGVAVGQAAGSGSAATNGEPERAALSPSVCGFCKGQPVGDAATWVDGKPRPPAPCPRCGLVGEPPSPSGRETPEAASLGTGESREHSGGSPTRRPRGDLASDVATMDNAAFKPPQSQTTNGHVPSRHLAAVPKASS